MASCRTMTPQFTKNKTGPYVFLSDLSQEGSCPLTWGPIATAGKTPGHCPSTQTSGRQFPPPGSQWPHPHGNGAKALGPPHGLHHHPCPREQPEVWPTSPSVSIASGSWEERQVERAVLHHQEG